ncbi:chemotaxis response regulator containing a CheY-like receiver domain and a methylesterase domain [Caulobacter sp. AP07]|uniref:protein-glutamate methylesterase/protein-glutamine glutaminase n=1 Tax=Caulobacter sp. AP07 TaxID=1144304 RepID=UPI000272076A|nr:chemotaxis response regulator protein-glutamate methylesterase [Caulobacter sp. AP07]EJL22110.1 chemotaxis response regulator containing a CheY-like receiver domain and a methylesterase domain [Caulobacter sp. AP07]
MAKIRVLVVDDSATMRGLITAALNRDPDIEVVGAAGDPFEARGMIKALNPDVVTLDIEMPNMNGIEFLEKIMRLRPMPVVMVSSLTQAGAEMTLRALELGAVDCVAKPTIATNTADTLNEVAVKVKAAARASVRTKADGAPAVRRKDYMPSGDIVAIGSSTGGVEALLSILSLFPETCPPTVITQHMPATFTASFAARLDRASGAKVQEAVDGALLEPGKVYVAPGGATHLEIVRSAGLRCRLTQGDPVSGHRPSVDVLFNSVAQAVGEKAVGAILTGMGRDGAQGLLAMRKAGARTVGQDEQSCVVYGMPRTAFELGAVEKQASLSSMGQTILDLASARR